jgi:hypothetical protein
MRVQTPRSSLVAAQAHGSRREYLPNNFLFAEGVPPAFARAVRHRYNLQPQAEYCLRLVNECLCSAVAPDLQVNSEGGFNGRSDDGHNLGHITRDYVSSTDGGFHTPVVVEATMSPRSRARWPRKLHEIPDSYPDPHEDSDFSYTPRVVW